MYFCTLKRTWSILHNLHDFYAIRHFSFLWMSYLRYGIELGEVQYRNAIPDSFWTLSLEPQVYKLCMMNEIKLIICTFWYYTNGIQIYIYSTSHRWPRKGRNGNRGEAPSRRWPELQVKGSRRRNHDQGIPKPLINVNSDLTICYITRAITSLGAIA